jgi:hypothetical protein
MIVGVLVVGVIVVAVTGAAGPAAAAPAAIVEGLVLIGAFVYAEVRLSLALPLTLLRGHFVLAESWRLTRGRFWTLFGGYLVLFLILLVFWVAVVSITMGPYLRDMVAHHGNPQAMHAIVQQQMMRQLWTGPMTLVMGVIGAALGAIGLTFFGGASGTAALILAESAIQPAPAATTG